MTLHSDHLQSSRSSPCLTVKIRIKASRSFYRITYCLTDSATAHYYQPGIGTYVETSSLAQKSRFGRIKSWYIKAKDEAIGTSFGEHVMAGYKFLMRYYSAGDDIYFFGFSRGAYTARFLAELLDYIGLLSAGNEEMLRFAWKTFALWQMRTEETEEERKKKAKTFVFMKKFRETFSRPIDRIRFIGLFDCVNSVPQFESAWMSRTKFPYTAKTSAMIIRHAVSIDERRTKFRQDLLSGRKFTSEEHSHHFHAHHHNHDHLKEHEETIHLDPESVRYRRKPRGEGGSGFHSAAASISGVSASSQTMKEERLGSVGHAQDAGVEDENDPQDILEVWFAGMLHSCICRLNVRLMSLKANMVTSEEGGLLTKMRNIRRATYL